MAIQHSQIQSADCHEPKHITVATTSDAGKVITPSATTSGTSVLRQLASAELSDGPALNAAAKKDLLFSHLEDLGTAASEYLLGIPLSTVQKATIVVESTFTVNTIVTIRSGGVTLGTVTLTAAGSAAGSVYTGTLTGTLNATGVIEVASDGGATGVLEGTIMIEATRP